MTKEPLKSMKEKQKRRIEKHGWFVSIVVMTLIIVDTQGCGLRKIMSSQKVSNHEILGALCIILYERSKIFQSPNGKR